MFLYIFCWKRPRDHTEKMATMFFLLRDVFRRKKSMVAKSIAKKCFLYTSRQTINGMEQNQQFVVLVTETIHLRCFSHDLWYKQNLLHIIHINQFCSNHKTAVAGANRKHVNYVSRSVNFEPMLTWISSTNNIVCTNLLSRNPPLSHASLMNLSGLGRDFGFAPTNSQYRGTSDLGIWKQTNDIHLYINMEMESIPTGSHALAMQRQQWGGFTVDIQSVGGWACKLQNIARESHNNLAPVIESDFTALNTNWVQ